jgi:hypothetical protein
LNSECGIRILTTKNLAPKLENKKFTTDKHGGSRKEIAPIKLLQKNISFPCYSVKIRGEKFIIQESWNLEAEDQKQEGGKVRG